MKLASVVVTAILALPGGWFIYSGISFFGTPWWGYADNTDGFYFVLGGIIICIGLAMLAPGPIFMWWAWVREPDRTGRRRPPG